MEQLTQRDREARTSQAFASLSANIRIKLNHYSQQVQDLRYKINQARRDQIMYPSIYYQHTSPSNAKLTIRFLLSPVASHSTFDSPATSDERTRVRICCNKCPNCNKENAVVHVALRYFVACANYSAFGVSGRQTRAGATAERQRLQLNENGRSRGVERARMLRSVIYDDDVSAVSQEVESAREGADGRAEAHELVSRVRFSRYRSAPVRLYSFRSEDHRGIGRTNRNSNAASPLPPVRRPLQVDPKKGRPSPVARAAERASRSPSVFNCLLGCASSKLIDDCELPRDRVRQK
ncbi:unnamed protein product [Trichogramma brassicae]|uniref:Uncharacterized protein n=1 Tax=Trichogramma brassicae TaxID=86971 RepID=A0A6H5I9K9_9HYME|nr:unnamed protein product [Trichogramma brassicae]